MNGSIVTPLRFWDKGGRVWFQVFPLNGAIQKKIKSYNAATFITGIVTEALGLSLLRARIIRDARYQETRGINVMYSVNLLTSPV